MKRLAIIGLVAAAATSLVVLATPGIGRLYQNTLSFGFTDEDLTEHIVRNGGPGIGTEWELKLKTHGASDVYQQESGLAPGGYSGWHTHPGLLVLTVVDGTLAWYDENCAEQVYETGDVFTESDTVHNVRNIGTVDAHYKVFYIVQKGQPRRGDSPAPPCGAAIGLP